MEKGPVKRSNPGGEQASWATSPATRRSMLANRGRDTKPELSLRRALHRLGYRFRVDIRPLPDVNRRADIVFTRQRVAIFVHGCFWHGCPDHYVAPKANSTFWADKIERNITRDAETVVLMRQAGWTPVVIWEHQSLDEAIHAVGEAVRNAGGTNPRPISPS